MLQSVAEEFAKMRFKKMNGIIGVLLTGSTWQIMLTPCLTLSYKSLPVQICVTELEENVVLNGFAM